MLGKLRYVNSYILGVLKLRERIVGGIDAQP
jgi:hypothetical protein